MSAWWAAWVPGMCASRIRDSLPAGCCAGSRENDPETQR
eukprot:CAMPEP_0204348590 /NCGR_PEP_ID=MMETSP0469-20131031/28851_1 /ASSEMBLY_ACC=CAM_ASM_000384 /TAXON_ID=2969 /ORGANISM="Oxyrrhis marina" /LENGTH=38 /DNA_ID= /DNA_START= /DNA_END= /DNA_ORIENTATION=